MTQQDATQKVAEGFGDFLVWMTDHISTNGILVFIGVVIVAYLLWRISIAVAPMKLCWRCSGNGHVGGFLGGRRQCTRCKSGLRPRIGAKK
jgi:hypothetical protein